VIRVLLSVAWVLLAAVAGAHPYHESQAEIDYREPCSCLEITLRLKAEELEAALLRASAPHLPLEDPQLRERLQQYVLGHFVLTGPGQQPLALQWVGMEVDALGAWFYLQSPAVRLPVQLRNDLLLEQQDEQVNRVLFRANGYKQSLRFSRDSPRVQWLQAEAVTPAPASPR
jgi:hypothetical protein